MTKFLRGRILASAWAGYHNAPSKWPRERLLCLRARDDKGFNKGMEGNLYRKYVARGERDQPSFLPSDNFKQVVVPSKTSVPLKWAQNKVKESLPVICTCERCTRTQTQHTGWIDSDFGVYSEYSDIEYDSDW